MDPRFRGGDDGFDFHFYAWAAGPCPLRMTELRLRRVVARAVEKKLRIEKANGK